MDIRAVLFDLNDTLTATRCTVNSILRDICHDNGIDLDGFSDAQLDQAIERSDRAMNDFLIASNAGPHWGANAEDWIPFDRILFEDLGIHGLTDDKILTIERDFKYVTRETDWEYFTKDALECLDSVKAMGYLMGICTARSDEPKGLIERNNLCDMFRTAQWSGVPGYRKPSPFTLLEASKELKVNPRHCIFVGNYVHSDVQAALRCEMTPILLTWANPSEGAKAANSCVVLENPTDIIQWIQSSDESFKSLGS